MKLWSKRWRYGLFAVGLLSIAVALVIIFHPRERLLLQRATRVARLDKGAVMGTGSSNYWLSGQDVLFSRSGPLTKSISRLNLKTGRETSLSALSRLYNKSVGKPVVEWEGSPSPDGQWLLWETDTGMDGATLDGAHSFHTTFTPDGRPLGIYWMPDSRHWAEFVRDDEFNLISVRVHSIDTPRSVQTLQFPTGKLFSRLKPHTGISFLIAITPQAHLLALASYQPITLWSDTSDYSTERFIEVDLHAPGKLLRTFPVHGPKDVFFSNAAFSPQGDRIAWLRKTEYVPPSAFLWLHRLFPRFKVYRQPAIALWVNHLDGSHMREIGHVAVKPDWSNWPDQVDWTPDGKRLSFAYQVALYTVPAD